MNTKTAQPQKIEDTAKEMRSLVLAAQRKLLEFEVIMSQKEIGEGKAETFASPEDLFKTLS